MAATLNSIGVASVLIDPKVTFHFKISSVNPPLGDIRELLVTIFDKRGLTHWSVVKHESFMLLISGSYSIGKTHIYAQHELFTFNCVLIYPFKCCNCILSDRRLNVFVYCGCTK